MYQCPSTGYIHFYKAGKLITAKKISVSMPFNGLTSFLQNGNCFCVFEFYMYQCPLTGFIHFYPATWEAPVYKALKGAFSPRFFKLLQKCYILPFFCFYKILLLICVLFYHIFLINARTFLTILFRRVKRINGI